jgi:hypothetical protein
VEVLSLHSLVISDEICIILGNIILKYVTPCSLVQVYRRSGRTCCLYLHGTWRQRILLKRRYPYTRLHCVTSQRQNLSKIWGAADRNYESYCLLERDDLWSGRTLTDFGLFSEDGSSTFLRNFGNVRVNLEHGISCFLRNLGSVLPDYTASHLRRPQSEMDLLRVVEEVEIS